MVKAIDFFKVLCEDLNYRFFSGVVCKELSTLFKTMDDSFMYYVPAVNEFVALGLTIGVSITGVKSVLVLDMKLKEFIYPDFDFLMKNKLPIMLIGYSENKKESFKYDIPIIYFENLDDLSALSKKMDKKSIPGMLIIGKDMISK